MNIQEIASASALIKQELEPLAQKLGQGAEYTFQLFVKQAYAEAVSNLSWVVVGIIILSICKKLYVGAKYMFDDDGNFFGFVLWGILLFLGLAAVMDPVTNLLLVIINPEYQAIKLILETFRSVK